MKLKTTDNEKARFLLFLSFKHFHEANRCDQYRKPGDRQAVTLYCVAIKDEAQCRNRSLSVVHLSGYLMGPRAMNQGMSLQRSVGGCRMRSDSSERIPCEPGINSVQFEPPWLFCAFLGYQLERVHHRVTGALQQGGDRTAKWFRVSGSGPEGCTDTLQALTTTTAVGGCNG